MSRLFEIFSGEYVRITLTRNSKQTIEHKGAIKTVESPMVVEGYFTEEDDDHLYLGIQPGQIQAVVIRELFGTMEIIDPNEEQDDILNEFMEKPTKKTGMN